MTDWWRASVAGAVVLLALAGGCASGGDGDRVDSGVATFDSSTPRDAGPVGFDAGPRPDAGGNVDAGRPTDSGIVRFDAGRPTGDGGIIGGLDAGGLFCTTTADCSSMPGTCCLAISGMGFCVPGMEFAGICVPSG